MVHGGLQKAIVIGGSGALGRSLIHLFRPSWEVTSIDFSPNPDAHKAIPILAEKPVGEQHATILKALDGKYQAVMCVAGGFLAGSITAKEIVPQCDTMLRMNLQPSLLAAYIACRHLSPSGLLLFTGAAAPFTAATPSLLAYGLAKTTVHTLAANLAESKDLPDAATVVTILPETIDTKRNREEMKDADFSKWLDPTSISAIVKMWAEGLNRPLTGSFAHLKKSAGCVVPEFL